MEKRLKTLIVGLSLLALITAGCGTLTGAAVGAGTTHELQASKETFQNLKAGDRIEAKLRTAPNCSSPQIE